MGGNMEGLNELAKLIHKRNEVDDEISDIIERPALCSHIGEYIASKIFDIKLEKSSNNKGFDGYFTKKSFNGNFNKKSVNIKFYPKRENILDINPKYLPNYYLVMTGPKSNSTTSLKAKRPLLISNVYLFDSKKLIDKLNKRINKRTKLPIKIGIATSVASEFWEEAEVYPEIKDHFIKTLPNQLKFSKLLNLFNDSLI